MFFFLAIARVQRQISDPTTAPFPGDNSPQELSPVTSPSSNRPTLSMGIKSPTFSHPTQTNMRPTPSQTPLEFSDTESYTKSPTTPKPLSQQTFQPRLPAPADPFILQSTPRPQFQLTRPQLQSVRAEPPELNRQLRELLQKQQFKKLDEQILAGKGQQRVWPPPETLTSESEVRDVFQSSSYLKICFL